MIVGSLVLILAAAGLLAGGLILPSDVMLGGSIVASLIAAVMLYIGARQSSASRADERAATDDWGAESAVDDYDRKDGYSSEEGYPTEQVDAGSYPVAGRYEGVARADERFADARHEDERYDMPQRSPEQPYEADPRYDADQRYEDQRYEGDQRYEADQRYQAVPESAEERYEPERPVAEDRFADLRQYEEAAFSDPQTASYDRAAGYPEPPVSERMWTPQSTDRVPSQRDVTAAGHDDAAGYQERAGSMDEPTAMHSHSEHPEHSEPVGGAHAAPEPAHGAVGGATVHGSGGYDADPVPPPRAEQPAMSPEARRLAQLPPDELIGGGVDEEDPKDEPPIQRRTAQVAATVARMTVDVFVIDGRPRYHVAGCVHLLGRESEPLPADEAVDLGFTPCSLCEPDTVLTSGATEKARR